VTSIFSRQFILQAFSSYQRLT